MVIIQNQPVRHHQVVLTQLRLNAVIIPQDQIDHEPIRFTIPVPLLRNQAILVTLAIIVSTAHYSSQYFRTMNSTMLSSKLTPKDVW